MMSVNVVEMSPEEFFRTISFHDFDDPFAVKVRFEPEYQWLQLLGPILI
jgi:hypothetical protein